METFSMVLVFLVLILATVGLERALWMYRKSLFYIKYVLIKCFLLVDNRKYSNTIDYYDWFPHRSHNSSFFYNILNWNFMDFCNKNTEGYKALFDGSNETMTAAIRNLENKVIDISKSNHYSQEVKIPTSVIEHALDIAQIMPIPCEIFPAAGGHGIQFEYETEKDYFELFVTKECVSYLLTINTEKNKLHELGVDSYETTGKIKYTNNYLNTILDIAEAFVKKI